MATTTVRNSPYNNKIMLLLFETPVLQIGPHNKVVISYQTNVNKSQIFDKMTNAISPRSLDHSKLFFCNITEANNIHKSSSCMSPSIRKGAVFFYGSKCLKDLVACSTHHRKPET